MRKYLVKISEIYWSVSFSAMSSMMLFKNELPTNFANGRNRSINDAKSIFSLFLSFPVFFLYSSSNENHKNKVCVVCVKVITYAKN